MSVELEVIRYPRGYMSPIKEGNIRRREEITYSLKEKESTGNKSIAALYDLYASGAVKSTSWNFRKRVIEIASRELGNVSEWLILQVEHNDYVYGTNYDFLLDVINFIETGYCNMSPMTWNELVLEHHNPEPRVSRGRKVDLSSIVGGGHHIIAKWCSKEGGFEHMLCTLHVLLGVAKKPVSNKS